MPRYRRRTVQSQVLNGVLIAAIPLIPLAVAFAFEAGYVSYFGIPLGLIDLNWTIILLAAGTMLSFLYLFGVLAMALRQWADQPLRTFERFLIILVAPSVLVVALVGFRWDIALLVPLAVAISFVLTYGPVIFMKGKSFKQKLENFRTESSRQWSPFDAISDRYGRAGVYVVVILIMSTIYSWAFGRGVAIREKDFFLAEVGERSMAVVRFYGDRVVGVSLNAEERSIGPEVFVLDAAGLGAVTKEEIGPLRPVES